MLCETKHWTTKEQGADGSCIVSSSDQTYIRLDRVKCVSFRPKSWKGS